MAQMIKYPSSYLEVLLLAKKQFNANLGDRELLFNKKTGLENTTASNPAEQDTSRQKRGVSE